MDLSLLKTWPGLLPFSENVMSICVLRARFTPAPAGWSDGPLGRAQDVCWSGREERGHHGWHHTSSDATFPLAQGAVQSCRPTSPRPWPQQLHRGT